MDKFIETGLRRVLDIASGKISPEPPAADLCTRDGSPCHVGAGTDDAHWRCGTVQCGSKMAGGAG